MKINQEARDAISKKSNGNDKVEQIALGAIEKMRKGIKADLKEISRAGSNIYDALNDMSKENVALRKLELSKNESGVAKPVTESILKTIERIREETDKNKLFAELKELKLSLTVVYGRIPKIFDMLNNAILEKFDERPFDVGTGEQEETSEEKDEVEMPENSFDEGTGEQEETSEEKDEVEMPENLQDVVEDNVNVNVNSTSFLQVRADIQDNVNNTDIQDNVNNTDIQDNVNNTDIPEDSNTTDIPEDSNTTDIPEDSNTTDIPEDSNTTDIPEDSNTTDIPEDSNTTDIPEDSNTGHLIIDENIIQILDNLEWSVKEKQKLIKKETPENLKKMQDRQKEILKEEESKKNDLDKKNDLFTDIEKMNKELVSHLQKLQKKIKENTKKPADSSDLIERL